MNENRFFPFEFEVWRDNEMLFSARGKKDDAYREAFNYAEQNSKDGTVRIFEVSRKLTVEIRGKVKRKYH